MDPHTSANPDALHVAIEKLRVRAFEIIATDHGDPHATLSRMQTLASQMDGIADDAFAAERRAGQ